MNFFTDLRLTFFFRRVALPVLLGILFAGCQTTPPESAELLAVLDEPGPSDIYHLRVGDIVQVDVFQEPGMTTRQRVQGDGTISVGLIGRVRVLGEGVEQAADRIAKLLDKKYLINPQVNVTVLAYSPRRFTVWGQVQRPGSYVIPPEQHVSLPEAIAMAGGNSNIGNLRKVFVSRKKDGGVKRIRIDALSSTAQYFNVREGDVIFVTETVF
jgi:protein involved in polysaccharide export with SLBB domain